MTVAQCEEVKALIRFYERRGADWSLAAEFTIRRYSGTWPEPARFGGRYPKKETRKQHGRP